MTQKDDKRGKGKLLIGIGGAVASAGLAAALLYSGKSKKKKAEDKLAAAELTPPTD